MHWASCAAFAFTQRGPTFSCSAFFGSLRNACEFFRFFCWMEVVLGFLPIFGMSPLHLTFWHPPRFKILPRVRCKKRPPGLSGGPTFFPGPCINLPGISRCFTGGPVLFPLHGDGLFPAPPFLSPFSLSRPCAKKKTPCSPLQTAPCNVVFDN